MDYSKQTASSGQSRRAFTLVELLVVVTIIVILMAALLPALAAVRMRATSLASKAQLQAISGACEGYFLDHFAYPGFAPESYFSSTATANEWTSAENLVVSLLGRVSSTSVSGGFQIPSLSPTAIVDVNNIGAGPKTSVRTFDAYYAPKAKELQTITGDVGNDNNKVPEFIDPAGGMPILYWRSTKQGDKPVANWGGTSKGQYGRNTNRDFTASSALVSTRGKTVDNSAKSLIHDGPAGGNSNANGNLAWLVTHSNLSNYGANEDSPNDEIGDVLRGAFVLLAGGKDGIYLNSDDAPNGQGAIGSLANFESLMSDGDDVVHHGGSR